MPRQMVLVLATEVAFGSNGPVGHAFRMRRGAVLRRKTSAANGSIGRCRRVDAPSANQSAMAR